MNNQSPPKPTHKDVWNFNIEDKIFIEIVHWGVDRENVEFKPLNNGAGVWNYYCLIPERLITPEVFKELWLSDKVVKWSEHGQFHIIHDYMNERFNQVFWHGGITHYSKVGQVEGFRLVKLGCDYNHLWNEERGFRFDIDEVASEAIRTAKELIELYGL